jgi:hypothetical protein
MWGIDEGWWFTGRFCAGCTVLTGATGTLVDVVASVSIAFPSNVARAIVLTGPEMMACCIEVVTIVFLVCANVDRVLTILTIIRLTLTCTMVDDFAAITVPFTHGFVTGGIVHARIANALVHVNVAVATKRRVVGVVIALQHSTLWFILEDIGHSIGIDTLRTVLTPANGVTAVLTHAVGKPINACALVCMERHTRLHTRLGARGAVPAWAAVALVHIEIAVASRTWWPWLQVRCDEAIKISTVAFEYSALIVVLRDTTLL